MKAFFKWRGRPVNLLVLGIVALMLLVSGQHSYAEELGSSCTTDQKDQCSCDLATKIICNGSSWVNGPICSFSHPELVCSAVAPTVTTNTEVTNITTISASSGGEVTSDGGDAVTARGVCWGTSASPSTNCTTNGTGAGTFTSLIEGLNPGTTYYVRAYATNTVDTSYGADVTFATSAAATAPTVTTNTEVTSITGTTASGGGEVTSHGGADVTARGVCWGTSASPTTNCTTDGTGIGTFTSSVDGLEPDTTYYVRAYATNSVDTSYGNDVTFDTLAPPSVTTTSVSPIFGSFNGTIDADGGSPISERGFCWSISQNPTLADSHESDGQTALGSFTIYPTGLASGTTYYVRAYATNSVGLTGYGENKTFATEGAHIVTDVTSVTISEGSTGTFKVKLSEQPTSDVTVTVGVVSGGDTDITVQSGQSLTFTTTDWSADQTVTIEAAEDDDASHGTATIELTASGGLVNTKTVTTTESDNDTLAFVTDSASVTVGEGGTGTFNVKLSAQPDSSLTVSVARASGDPDISVQTGPSLTFTTSNWNTTQTVTLAAAEDDDNANGTATIQVSATGLTSVSVAATEQDDDMLVTDLASADVPEGGTISFNVKLSAQPASDVTVTVSKVSGGDTDITVQSGQSLTFTTSDWSSNQAVTLAATEDDDTGNGTAIIRLSAAGIDPREVTATEQDNDTLALVTDPTSVTVTEGSSATFGVGLSAQPDSTVTVSVARASGDTDIAVQPASLTFTTSNWNTSQTVTLTAAEDDDTTSGTATIQVIATGGLSESKDITATEGDNDVLALVIDPTSVTISEGGTATFGVKLSMTPGSDVTVTTSMAPGGDGDISLQSGGSLTFTTSNWATNQAITLEATEDDDTINGTGIVQVVASGGLTESKEVTATENDNDTLEIVTTPASVTVTENSTATFDVNLSAQPDGEVTVSVTRDTGDADISVQSGSSLTFTTSNWNTNQTVTLAAADDADVNNDTATIRLNADGFGPVDVTATEQDDDTLIIIAEPASVTVSEEDTAVFNVKLSLQPENTVTVSAAHESGDTDITVQSGASLTFTTSNWDANQAVTIAAAKDNDDIDDSAIIRLSADGLASVDVTATEQDAGFINGDIDCSGGIDMADLILALKISVGIDITGETTICIADVNNDGYVGVEEVIHILDELLK